MTQYPDEKGAQSEWLTPDQNTSYTSRDGAPSVGGLPPPPAQGYYPPQGPPPGQSAGYAPPPQGPPPNYAQTNPYQSQSPNDHKSSVPPPAGPYDAYGGPAPAPQAGPSASSSNQDGGSAMSLSSFFGNKGPPPMWQRPPPAHLPYPSFPPMCLISNGHELNSGFPELPPPCPLNPHPFATHDITEEDWKRFLVDVKNGGSLSPAQRIKSNVIPLVTGMNLISGLLATFAIERRMNYGNRQAAGDVVDHWNHYFFGPRRMEVVLCQASERLSGKFGAAPIGDPIQQRMANRLRHRGPDDSSDSDDYSSEDEGRGQGYGRQQFGFGYYGQQNYQHGYDRFSRLAAIRERRDMKRERRDMKRERRDMKRARRYERRERKARGEDRLPYQLFITAI